MGERTRPFVLTGTETIGCPICLGDLKPYDRRERTAITSDGEQTRYWLRRLRCQSCLKLHLELPDTLIPYKRYQAQVIEQTITGSTGPVPHEERTRQKIRRWYQRVHQHLSGVWQSIRSGLASPGRPPTLSALVRAAVNSGMWLFHPNGRTLSVENPL